MRIRSLFGPALIVVALAAFASPVQERRSTQDGVFTAAQAARGRDVFATYCQSCHTPTFHTGPAFRAKWFGRTLGDLFGFLRREMPKSDPGTLSDEEYTSALAFLMRMNGMPTGDTPLASDSSALQRIRIDSLRPVSPSTGLFR